MKRKASNGDGRAAQRARPDIDLEKVQVEEKEEEEEDVEIVEEVEEEVVEEEEDEEEEEDVEVEEVEEVVEEVVENVEVVDAEEVEEEEDDDKDEEAEDEEEDQDRDAGEEDGEDEDPDADLFGPDNEEYMRTTAQSRLRPPRLPPPQFPRKQDYRDASWRNAQQGGRYNDKGPHSGGRYNDKGTQGVGRYNGKGSSQPPLLPTPPGSWQNPMYSWAGRSGAAPANDLLVADMKLGAVGHHDEVLRLNCPQFQEPAQIACYSRTADGNVHYDDRCLRRFRRAVLTELGADLNEGYEKFVAKKDVGNEGFGDLLSCLRNKRLPLDNIHFVTFRNNLNKILGTAYNRSEPWEMGVHKRRGSVYLDVHKLPESQNAFQQKSSYWGYSFERLATEEQQPHSGRHISNGSSRHSAAAAAVDANVEFCVVIRTKLGAHRIVMGAEMDCYEGNPDGKRHYIELKTTRELAGRTVDKFEREKLLKFWIQSFLAGVGRIVVGFRDDAGHLVRTEVMGLKEITHRVKAKHLWEGGVCLAFADRVLCWLYGTVKENEDYTLRFVPQQNRLELLKAQACPEVVKRHLEELPHGASPS